MAPDFSDFLKSPGHKVVGYTGGIHKVVPAGLLADPKSPGHKVVGYTGGIHKVVPAGLLELIR